MLTRRQFVHYSALILGLPSLGAYATSRLPALQPHLLIEAGVPDVESFLAHCPGAGPCASIANGFAEFEVVLADRATDAIFGLSRDSTYVLYHQIALTHGFATAYLGEHDARGGSLRHTLRGSEASISSLGRSLASAHLWPQALGLSLPALALSVDPGTLLEVTSEGTPTRGYWVSWLLRRA